MFLKQKAVSPQFNSIDEKENPKSKSYSQSNLLSSIVRQK